MTTVKYIPDDFRIEISGHAGSAPAGEDLVCAACTAFARQLITAASDVPQYNAHYYINDLDAVISVQCYPIERYKPRCSYMLSIILAGFEMLAADYPEYVKVIGGYND